MAAPIPSAAISAAFPAPPPFYKSFTPANLAAYREPPSTTPPWNPPPELRHLVPPPPPPDGKYRSFGTQHDVTPTPPQTSPPTPQRLLKITHSLLLTFLSLTHALATNPAAYAPLWDQLRALFTEAHAVVNEYRPHQARETLIAMMEAQVARGREEVRGWQEMGERVREVLEGVSSGEEVTRLGEGRKGEVEGEDEENRVWEVVGEEIGFV